MVSPRTEAASSCLDVASQTGIGFIYSDLQELVGGQ